MRQHAKFISKRRHQRATNSWKAYGTNCYGLNQDEIVL